MSQKKNLCINDYLLIIVLCRFLIWNRFCWKGVRCFEILWLFLIACISKYPKQQIVSYLISSGVIYPVTEYFLFSKLVYLGKIVTWLSIIAWFHSEHGDLIKLLGSIWLQFLVLKELTFLKIFKWIFILT